MDAQPQADADVVMEDELEYESDVEADLEVDELDSSGSDQENAAPTSISASGKQRSVGKPGTRAPGHTILPQVRIENILQADGITSSLPLSKDGQFILSVATEEFIKRLARTGFEVARSKRQQNMVNYVDMAAAVSQQHKEFIFLRDTIPQPFTLAEGWELRRLRLREMMEQEPALGGVVPQGSFQQSHSASPEPEPAPPTASTSKRKKNGAADLGQTNGHSTSTNTGVTAPEIASISTTPQVKSSRVPKKNGSSLSASVLANGHGASSSALSTPSEEKEDAMDVEEGNGTENDNMTGDEPPWPKPQFTGPASGFLQGPGAPFGGVGADTQGRTIYSQKNQPD